ncbi:versican core protein-like protein [Aphelenchoides avenae]|nr:versican core protein-like protein [Aphelenchus avenae]
MGVVSTYSRHVFTYHEASTLCADHSAALVSVPDLATNYFVLALALSEEGGYGETAVLGLQYNGSAWLWADGSHANYTYWATGYPKDAKVNQVAGMQLAVYAGSPSFAQWINYDPSTRATVICERRPNV